MILVRLCFVFVLTFWARRLLEYVGGGYVDTLFELPSLDTFAPASCIGISDFMLRRGVDQRTRRLSNSLAADR